MAACADPLLYAYNVCKQYVSQQGRQVMPMHNPNGSGRFFNRLSEVCQAAPSKREMDLQERQKPAVAAAVSFPAVGNLCDVQLS